ncbi:helix-turn-helix domain-containing protein [Psychroflexus sp. MES1-P1E]|uniref:helix-turn-helix domain-containing protein n=1 Tax=Psychroflexus sp. MES1-P1E TaxID=2058320 RepID=UPI000C7C0FF3|nr:helix-turn-helix transcriptional regulator [Psychroflexus sp. MES1-P1E]PKG44172.1 XRE family transcriptional regulator [Psychroflexus sp. MES1-P1E]
MDKEELKGQIGRRIIKLRAVKGWSQSDLARASNKDRQAIEKLENGRVNPTIFSLYEIAKVLDVTLSELLKLK